MLLLFSFFFIIFFYIFIFFFHDTATTEIYTLSLHDALPIFFCFSCGSINSAAPDAGNLKYFITFKLDKADLKQWCANKDVDQMIMKRLTTAGYL